MSTTVGAEKCPSGCGHDWHGLTCVAKWAKRADGTVAVTPDQCGCPGPWPAS